jgi:hypothetical protein
MYGSLESSRKALPGPCNFEMHCSTLWQAHIITMSPKYNLARSLSLSQIPGFQPLTSMRRLYGSVC